MKKYIQYGIALMSIVVLSGMLTSCEEWLDLKPESEIILDEYWQSEADVESVLAACYRGLTEDGVVYRMMVWGELRSDNIDNGIPFHRDRYDMQRIIEGDITANNAYAAWGSFYSVINYCNNLLYYAPEVVNRDINFSSSDLNRLRAEVLSLRALTYFYLTRTFKEVPLMLSAVTDGDSTQYNLPKATEAEILDQIVDDLLEAKKYARFDFGSNRAYNKGRITLNAVNAILADVYLWRGDYSQCVAVCDEIISTPSLRLIPGQSMLTQVFYLGNSAESIFELQFDDNVQVNNAVRSLYGTSSLEIGEFSFPATLAYDEYNNSLGMYSPFMYRISQNVIESEKDIRFNDFFTSSGGKYRIFKYSGMTRSDSNIPGLSEYRFRYNSANWIIYRLSDIILMKAEALVQLARANDNSVSLQNQAVRLVNIPYLRSNEGQDSLMLVNYPTIDDVEKLVLRERQRELLFEGKRWYDLVRFARREGSTSTMNQFVGYKNPASTMNLGARTMDAMYMPISQREIEANRKLKQNPFYEDETSSSER
ncbi:MAG: RagB/SusD family nutrient uptake outer membrane protein [Paludibacter sp.]|nr:RagB/SusD family nutrient uptake outer membrane protein [Paludibacter sp.]